MNSAMVAANRCRTTCLARRKFIHRPTLNAAPATAVVDCCTCSVKTSARCWTSERSTLAGMVGGCTALLQPLLAAIWRYVLAAAKLHGDDTPPPVLAPGNGRTKTGRL